MDDAIMFVIATNNLGKLREICSVLGPLGIGCMSLGEAGVDIEVEETGMTFYENALLKARAVCSATGKPAIADDSGLVVEALGGAPGVYSKRFGGGLDDRGLCLHLLQKMEGMEQRGAKFVCSVVAAFPGGDTISAEGECHGEIALGLSGGGGFGYDPVFWLPSKGRTMAQLTQEEKSEISHRGNALRGLATMLKSRCGI